VSVVRINVLQVPEGRGEVLEQRFASRAGEVEKVDGFESFELLRPTENFDRYLVITRWRDEEAFQAWMASMAFQQGHARSAADAEAADSEAAGAEAAGAEAPAGAGHPGGPPAGHPGGAPAGDAPAGSAPAGGGPAAVGSELWSFDVVTSATKAEATEA
jgi:heme oxygenase (mycobilin-producing)